MAHEYLKGQSTTNGEAHIAYSVVESIARIGIEEIEGVIIVDGSFKKGVTSVVENSTAIINADVKIKYGYNADRIARQIQERVVKDVRQMADVHVDQVNVNILGFQF